MAQTIKLTLRLPNGLHQQVKQRAYELNNSLNTTIVEMLRKSLAQEITYEENEREKTLRVLRERGLSEPMGAVWDDIIKDAPNLSHEEWRERLEGVPPLSEVIIEEREPR